KNTGKVLAWMGTAMYAAFALGAPAGTILYGSHGFTAIALATTLAPLATLLLVARLRRVAPTARSRPAFSKVVAAVWLPGAGLALSSVGLGAVTAFVALLSPRAGGRFGLRSPRSQSPSSSRVWSSAIWRTGSAAPRS